MVHLNKAGVHLKAWKNEDLIEEINVLNPLILELSHTAPAIV